MTIKDRIEFHQKHKERWWSEKERLEVELNAANMKVLFHWAAIDNLLTKQRLTEKQHSQNE